MKRNTKKETDKSNVKEPKNVGMGYGGCPETDTWDR